jgi:ribosomal protein S18 acetylase RimI-like enzyme
MKAAKYIVRYAKPGDFKTLFEMGSKAWPEWYAENHIHDERHIKYSIKNKRAIVTVLNGKIIGYAFFDIVWNYMHLQAAYVKPEYRRIGVGSAQLKKRIEIARSLNLKKILSDCDVDNKAAYKYHIKNGFERCGYIKRLWDDTDSFVFSIDLPAQKSKRS